GWVHRVNGDELGDLEDLVGGRFLRLHLLVGQEDDLAVDLDALHGGGLVYARGSAARAVHLALRQRVQALGGVVHVALDLVLVGRLVGGCGDEHHAEGADVALPHGLRGVLLFGGAQDFGGGVGGVDRALQVGGHVCC